MKKTRLAPLSALIAASFSAQAAVYQVVELPVNDGANRTFAKAINNQGQVVAILDTPFHPQIDVSLLDFDNTTISENVDVEAVQAGNISDDDRIFLYNYLRTTGGNSTQKFASYLSVTGDDNGSDPVIGLDIINPDFNDYSRSADTQVADINDNGWIIGSSNGSYTTEPYTSDNDVTFNLQIRDFFIRGFVQVDDMVVPLTSSVDTAGGFSAVNGINNNGWVVGSSAGRAMPAFLDSVENCEDDETRGDQPVALCLQNLVSAASFESTATLWKINDQLQVEERVTFDPLITAEQARSTFSDPDSFELENIRLTTNAYDVNNNGVVVGDSVGIYTGPEVERIIPTNSVQTMAVVFDDQGTTAIGDQQSFYSSRALGINDNGKVMGIGYTYLSGSARSKLFVYDMEDAQATTITGFFQSSSTTPRGINNNNQIVGDAEIEASLSSTRAKSGFIYDIDEDSFQRVNDLLACDSAYDIVQANDINDNGVIFATALTYKDILDINGNPVTNDDGSPQRESTTVAVKLVPVPGGSIEDCSDDEPFQERQGGSMSWLALLATGLMLRLRRR